MSDMGVEHSLVPSEDSSSVTRMSDEEIARASVRITSDSQGRLPDDEGVDRLLEEEAARPRAFGPNGEEIEVDEVPDDVGTPVRGAGGEFNKADVVDDEIVEDEAEDPVPVSTVGNDEHAEAGGDGSSRNKQGGDRETGREHVIASSNLERVKRALREVEENPSLLPFGDDLFTNDQGEKALKEMEKDFELEQVAVDKGEVQLVHNIVHRWNVASSDGVDRFKSPKEIRNAIVYARELEERWGVVDAGEEKSVEDGRDDERETADRLYGEFTKDDWWKLVNNECLERELRGGVSGTWDSMGLENAGGIEIPIDKYLRRHNPDFWRTELLPYIEARRSIDKAGKMWRKHSSSVGELLAHLGYPSEKFPMTSGEKIEFDFSHLAAIAESSDGLGDDVDKCIAFYLKIIRTNREYFELKEKLKDTEVDIVYARSDKDPNLSVLELEKENLESKILAFEEEDSGNGNFLKKNIFDALAGNLQAIVDVREFIRTEVFGSDANISISLSAENIAYNLMFLFGYAGESNYSQSFNGDSLCSLYRPNDSWQGVRGTHSSAVSPGPELIVGKAGKRDTQPLSRIRFLKNLPGLVGDVLMKDGGVVSMEEALVHGLFAQIEWKQMPSTWGVLGFMANKANTLKTELSELVPKEEKLILEKMRTFKLLMEMVLDDYREVVGTKQRLHPLADGSGSWITEKPEYTTKPAEDERIQTVLNLFVGNYMRTHAIAMGGFFEDRVAPSKLVSMYNNLVKAGVLVSDSNLHKIIKKIDSVWGRFLDRFMARKSRGG